MRGSSLRPYFHHLEAAPIHTSDVVTCFLHHYTLSQSRTHLHMPEPPALLEVVDELHHPKLHQQVSDLLTAQVLVLSDVGVEVPYHNEILVPEVCQVLLQAP